MKGCSFLYQDREIVIIASLINGKTKSVAFRLAMAHDTSLRTVQAI